MKENIYDKICIKCGKTYTSKGKAPVGECLECLAKEEYFCNRCGQPIDYWEYNNNVEGYCEDCYEEECELQPDEKDWTDINYIENNEEDN